MSSIALNALFAGLLICCVIAFIWVVSRPAVVPGQFGGVASPESPHVTTPSVTQPADVVVYSVAPPPPVTPPPTVVPPPVTPAVLPPMGPVAGPDSPIVLIEISKNLVSGGTRVFHVGEVIVYAADGRKLQAADFAYAKYNSEASGLATTYPAANAIDGKDSTFTHTFGENVLTHKLTLKLKVPTKLYKIVIVNRQDCCGDRLNGATVSFIADTGAVVSSRVLNGSAAQAVPLKV